MFLYIANDYIQSYESKNCGRFIEYQVHRKKFVLYIKEYLAYLEIFGPF